MRRLHGFLVASGGAVVGLVAAAAAGAPAKWLVVFVGGILLATTFLLLPQKRRTALALFTVSITFFVAKRVYSSGYPMITGGPSSLGVFLHDLPLSFLGGVFILRMVRRNDPPVVLPAVLVPWALYVAWCGLTVINAVEPVLTMIELAWSIKMAFVVFIVANLVEDRRDLLLVVSSLVVGLALQVLVTYSQAYSGVWYTLTGDVERTTFQEAARTEVFRAGGTVGPHNVQAGYYALLIPIAASMGLVARGPALRATLALVVAGGMVAMFLTYSRNGYLSLAVALAALAILARRRRLLGGRGLLLGTWVVLFVALGSFVLLGDRLGERLRSWESLAPRLESADVALRMVAAHPMLGVGLNNFSLTMAQRAYAPDGVSSLQRTYFGGTLVSTVVHNKYLLVASETGVAGLALHLWALGAVLACAARLLKGPDSLHWGIGAGMMAAMAGMSIQMLFDIYNSDLLMTVFWTLAGLAYASSRIAGEEEQRRAGATLTPL